MLTEDEIRKLPTLGHRREDGVWVLSHEEAVEIFGEDEDSFVLEGYRCVRRRDDKIVFIPTDDRGRCCDEEGFPQLPKVENNDVVFHFTEEDWIE